MLLTAIHIISVTTHGLLFYDENEKVSWIDFKTCNRNWQTSRSQLTQIDERCVGWRNTRDGTLLDVEFFSDPKVRFVFISYAQRDGELLDPLYYHGGWITWDVS